jgi:hypothetical protein
MLQISRTENSKSSAVIHKVNYTQLYNQLKVQLPGELSSLFAKPDIGVNYTVWLSDDFGANAKLRLFSTLSEKEKNDAAAEIEDKKERIISILANSPVLSEHSENLFLIAEEDDIKIISDGTKSMVVLCRWGSKSNIIRTPLNPLTVVMNRPCNNRSNVTLQAKYHDGDFVSNIELNVVYKGGTKSYQTDEYGRAELGRFLHGAELGVYLMYGAEKRYFHHLIVDERTQYEVKIPRTGDALITVLNQDGISIPSAVLDIVYKNDKQNYKTNENGTLILENLEYGEIINIVAKTIIQGREYNANAELHINQPQNVLTINLREPRPANLTIRTLDQNDNVLSTAIVINSMGKTQDFITNDQGLLHLNALFEIGQILNIKAGEYNYELNGYKIKDKENEIILKISVPEPQRITVKLLDFNKQPLPGILIDFSSKNINEPRTTTNDAFCTFNKSDFLHNEKIKAGIHYPIKKKNGDVKTVIYSKKFLFDKNKNEYVLQMRKRNWWWLLLLLIPLLLIQCEKQVPIRVLNAETNAGLEDVMVSMNYCQHNLFRPYRFFAFDETNFVDTTNKIGYVKFEKVNYSIFSLLFFNFTKANFSALYQCHNPTATHYLYYLPDTVYLKVNDKEIKLNFLVVDKNTQNPLESAVVYLEYEDGNGKPKSRTNVTDSEGMIDFYISRCAKNIKIKGRKSGYTDDEIEENKVSDLEGDLQDKRKLELEETKNEIPCNSAVNSGGQGVTSDEYFIGKTKNFIIDYDFYSVKDKLVIYCGRVDERNKEVINTGFVNGRGRINIDLKMCKSDWITIEITGLSGTDWRYNVICP